MCFPEKANYKILGGPVFHEDPISNGSIWKCSLNITCSSYVSSENSSYLFCSYLGQERTRAVMDKMPVSLKSNLGDESYSRTASDYVRKLSVSCFITLCMEATVTQEGRKFENGGHIQKMPYPGWLQPIHGRSLVVDIPGTTSRRGEFSLCPETTKFRP